MFSESDRKELESLPERELNMLSDALECEPADVVATLLPKKKRTTRKKTEPKSEEKASE